MIAAPPAPPTAPIRPGVLAHLRTAAGWLLADKLNVLNQQPQGAPQIDCQTYPDNCGPAFPFRFYCYLASDVLRVNRGRLSFFLQAFRGYEATSGAGTSHSHTVANHTHTTPAHNHQMFSWNGAGLSVSQQDYLCADADGGAATHIMLTVDSPPKSALWTYAASGGATSGAGGGQTSSADSSHTHPMVAGIYESTVATGVTVKVNGVDRTSALGGGSGFTADQKELEIGQWLVIGQLNTIDLTPSGLGRILGHLTVISYIQSA